MAKKLAMHVVAAGPQFLSPEGVPVEVQTREKDVARQTVRWMWWCVCMRVNRCVCLCMCMCMYVYVYVWVWVYRCVGRGGEGGRRVIVCVHGC